MPSPAPNTEIRVGICAGRVLVSLGRGIGLSLDIETARSMGSDLLWGAEVIESIGATGIGAAVPIIQAGGHSHGQRASERGGQAP